MRPPDRATRRSTSLSRSAASARGALERGPGALGGLFHQKNFVRRPVARFGGRHGQRPEDVADALPQPDTDQRLDLDRCEGPPVELGQGGVRFDILDHQRALVDLLGRFGRVGVTEDADQGRKLTAADLHRNLSFSFAVI
jgi:hypothetical protein